MLAKFGGEENVKTYQRLDSFLQRSLKKDAYDKIRLAEPCVVCCGKYNRVFKFAVLGSTSLYVLENPPRSTKDILLHVALRSLKDVRLVDEIPAFFNNDLKSRVQRISLESHHGGIHSPASNVSDTSNEVSSSLSSSHSSSFDYLVNTASSSSNLQGVNNGSYLNFHESQSIEEMPLFKSFSSTIETTPQKSRKLPNPPVGMERCNASVMSESKKISRSLSTPTSSSTSGKISFRKSSLSRVSSSSSDGSMKHYIRNGSISEDCTVSAHSLHSRSSHTYPALLEANASSSSRSLPPLEKIDSNSDVDTSTSKTNVTEKKEDMNNMDIYLLSSKSNFYYHLEAAWIHCITETNSNSFTQLKTKYSSTRQEVVQKFVELQNEIMDQPPIEPLCILTKELCCSLKKLFHVKKLFWKEQKLFEYYSLLGCQLWKDTSHFETGFEGQLDCLLLIYQVLTAAIGETETLSHRNKYLYGNGVDTVHLLVCSLARWPNLLHAQSKRKNSQEMNAMFNDEEMHTDRKTEQEIFKDDFIDGSISLLYQLLNLAKQGQLLYHIESHLSPSSIAAFMKRSDGFDTFISCWVDRLVNLLNDSSHDKIEDSTMVYKHFMCLHQLIESNIDIKRLFKTKHSEEFRYYVLSSRTISKLSESPLNRLLLLIIDKLKTVMIST